MELRSAQKPCEEYPARAPGEVWSKEGSKGILGVTIRSAGEM